MVLETLHRGSIRMVAVPLPLPLSTPTHIAHNLLPGPRGSPCTISLRLNHTTKETRLFLPSRSDNRLTMRMPPGPQPRAESFQNAKMRGP